MQRVTGISDYPSQIVNLTAEDGSTVTLTLTVRPQQTGWYFDLIWNGVSPAKPINGVRITTFPNLLRQWKNLLSFGIACVTSDGREPLGAADFQSGYARLLLLSATDVAQIEASVFPGGLVS